MTDLSNMPDYKRFRPNTRVNRMATKAHSWASQRLDWMQDNGDRIIIGAAVVAVAFIVPSVVMAVAVYPEPISWGPS